MDQPTTVKLADGTTYLIPAGPWGSFTWVRQANLISVAYRQIGSIGDAERWAVEWQRRTRIWENLQAGADQAAVIVQFGKDVLLAPVRIAQDVGTVALKTGGAVVNAATTTLTALPWLLVGLLVVVGIGLNKGTITVRR